MENSVNEFGKRAVRDCFSSWTNDLIKETLAKQAFPFSVLMTHIQGDYNMSSAFRSFNGFNGECFYYVGKKKWDRRGAICAQVYSSIKFLPNFSDVLNLKKDHTFIALENKHRTSFLQDFNWDVPKKPLLLIGEEGGGIPDEYLDICEHQLEIPMFGSMRSFNLASAATVAMYDLITKKFLNNPDK